MQMSLCKLLADGVSQIFTPRRQNVYLLSRSFSVCWMTSRSSEKSRAVKFEAILSSYEKSEQIKRVALFTSISSCLRLIAERRLLFSISTRVYIYFECVTSACNTHACNIVKERDDLKRETAVESTHSLGRRSSTWPLIYIHTCAYVYTSASYSANCRGLKNAAGFIHRANACVNRRNRSGPDTSLDHCEMQTIIKNQLPPAGRATVARECNWRSLIAPAASPEVNLSVRAICANWAPVFPLFIYAADFLILLTDLHN